MERVCNRKIPCSRREYNDPCIRSWIKNCIDMLEQHASIEPWKRTSLLREIFPRGIIEQLKSQMTVFEDIQSSLVDKSSSAISSTTDETNVSLPSKRIQPKSSKAASIISKLNKSLFKESVRVPKKMLVYIKSRKPNPYLNFFKNPEILVSIWRPVPTPLLEQMSLREISEVISERIATQFIDWLSDYEMTDENINMNNVIDMFSLEDDFVIPMKVHIEELHSVTKEVGVSLGVLKRTKKEVLKREIERDVRATRVKLRTSAFGRTIPQHEQPKPLKKKNVLPWLGYSNAPPDLESMKHVWKGITHLESTRGFCQFMATEHPNVEPPKFLKDCGLLDVEGVKRIVDQSGQDVCTNK